MTPSLMISTINSPIGKLSAVFDQEQYLYAVDWCDFDARMLRLLKSYHGSNLTLNQSNEASHITSSLNDYFDGNINVFQTIKCRTGGTKFQKEVWDALRTIPEGQTLSYGELARKINRPQAVRAVGAANGANPISIVIPCHRVIGANGSLTGYAGGLERKKWLLNHEASFLNSKVIQQLIPDRIISQV